VKHAVQCDYGRAYCSIPATQIVPVLAFVAFNCLKSASHPDSHVLLAGPDSLLSAL